MTPLLAKARWRSPLLVMDEAHHLKNPGTALARQLQSLDLEKDLRTGDGAMAGAFDRMLFLTATPFQLGHHELVRVLERFGDVRWDAKQLGARDNFLLKLSNLEKHLNESQRTAITFQRSWSRLCPEDGAADLNRWWEELTHAPHESLTSYQRAVVDAFDAAKRCRHAAERALKDWILRHNKGEYWAGTDTARRKRLDGAAVAGLESSAGLPIPPEQLLPFFLAARSAVRAGQDLLGEALSSSYEAFRYTRQHRSAAKDEQDPAPDALLDLAGAGWYLSEFDHALEQCSGLTHPKIAATVGRVADLWESGEKVLVFAFYRHTCRALRIHISREVERRVMSAGRTKLREAGGQGSQDEIDSLLERAQRRYFDDSDSPGRRAIDTALAGIIRTKKGALDEAQMSEKQREALMDVMRRFMRVPTTLVRYFPLVSLDTMKPVDAVSRTLDQVDGSGVSWRQKLEGFVEFLTVQCSADSRQHFLEAALRTQTGGIRVEGGGDDDSDSDAAEVTVANVQVATGTTRRDTRVRLMRAFNTPFFPDILVCSEVMGEGVDLQRFCRHVIHHDLAWNPSTIEQRTGRIDRLGCKAEGRQPIVVYLPFLAGTADERQYRVMSDREQWFRVVMGQDEVERLVPPDASPTVPLPDAISDSLSFNLGLDSRRYT